MVNAIMVFFSIQMLLRLSQYINIALALELFPCSVNCLNVERPGIVSIDVVPFWEKKYSCIIIH
jgi:hypothetical protein